MKNTVGNEDLKLRLIDKINFNQNLEYFNYSDLNNLIKIENFQNRYQIIKIIKVGKRGVIMEAMH